MTGPNGSAVLVFRRSLGIRLLSLLTLGVGLAMLGAPLVGGDPPGRVGGLLGGGFCLVGAAACLSTFGDRVTLTAAGIRFDNRLWGRLWRHRSLEVPWDGVATVSEYRKTLFIVHGPGRRLILDSMERYGDLRRVIAQRCQITPVPQFRMFRSRQP